MVSEFIIEMIMPSEQTPQMAAIFDVCVAAHKSLMDSLENAEVTR